MAKQITSLGQNLPRIYGLLKQDARAVIDSHLSLNSIMPIVGVPQENSLLFPDYCNQFELTAVRWEEVLATDLEALSRLEQMRLDCKRLEADSSVTELLSSFVAMNSTEQSLWLSRMKVSVSKLALPPMPFFDLLRNRELAASFVKSLDTDQLSLMIELLLSIQQIVMDERRRELPHRLVDWLDFVVSRDHRFLVVNGVICSSVAGLAPNAIDRLRDRDDFSEIVEMLSFQQDRITSTRYSLPRWAWGRLRPFIHRLRIK